MSVRDSFVRFGVGVDMVDLRKVCLGSGILGVI